MKSLIIVAVTLMVFFGYGLTMAQTKREPAKTMAEEPALSQEDIKNLRESAQLINDLLSGKRALSMDKAVDKRKNPEPEPQKNMADVADRALSIMSSYITSAEQAFKKVAPEVWRIMIRQQYANAIARPMIPFMLLVFVTIFVVVVKRWWTMPTLKEAEDSDEDRKRKLNEFNEEWWERFWTTNIIPGALYFIFGIWASIRFSSSIQMLINPEYYAFRDLLQIVINRGGL